MRAGHDEPIEVDPLDAALDAELRAALHVDPSPALVARVRTKIANASEVSMGFRWLVPGGLAVAAMIVVGGLLIVRHTAPTRPASGIAQVSAYPAPTKPDASRGADTNNVARADIRPIAPRSAPGRSGIRGYRDGAVLISQAEVRGLRRLIALANQGDDSLVSLFAAPTADSETVPDEIVIAPITIEPLASDTQ